jgi:central kinetochore subunit Mis15/CHL4
MSSKKRKFYNSGILSNSYIPPLRAVQIERELQKLPPDSLFSLTQLWLSLTSTQPIPNTEQKKQGHTKQSLSKKYLEKLETLKNIKSKVQLKKKIINLLLVDFYPRGLNTLQLAQIDVQLLVDRPGTNFWVSSTVKIVKSTDDIPIDNDAIDDTKRNEKLKELPNYTFSLDSQQFLDNFIMNLANLYLTHVYISRHPYFPLILIRVQMYDYTFRQPIDLRSRGLISDLTNSTLDRTAKLQFETDFKAILSNKFQSKTNKIDKSSFQRQIQIQNQPQFKSCRPFYILLPISSPHVIHTPSASDDVITKLILQTLETTLANAHIQHQQNANIAAKSIVTNNKLNINSSIVSYNKIKLFKDPDVPKPIKNLNAIFLLKGISKFGSAIGAWAPYANGNVDMGIFDNELKHLIVQPESFIDLTEDDPKGDTSLHDRKIVAALKFKGSLNKVNSKKLFNKTNSIEILSEEGKENDDDNDAGDVEILDSSNNNIFVEEKNRLKDSYASIIPIHESSFEVESDITKFLNKKYKNLKKKENRKRKNFSFSMELLGTDVFGGLHELAVKGSVDPYKIPSWLTGDLGTAKNKIKDGKVSKLNS